jgi:alpha-tubulin suppressor-like RCC1 family protein
MKVNEIIKPLINMIVLLVLIIVLIVPAYASSGPDKFVAVSAGNGFILALGDDGSVWTWGRLYGEKLDNGTYYTSQPTPVQVPIEDVVAISAGYAHGLALKKDGTVWAWGLNEAGQLGDGTTVSPKIGEIKPTRVKGLDHVIMISAGASHSLALKDDGTVWAWGQKLGALGVGSLGSEPTPVQLNLSNITSIYGGCFAIKDDGTVWTWGKTMLETDGNGHAWEDDLKDLDNVKINTKPFPFQVPGLKYIKSIDTDNSHTVFVKNDGTVWAWGFDSYGQLGYGSSYISNEPYLTVPVQVRSLGNVIMVATPSTSSMALKNDGTVWAWGNDGSGQLGTGEYGTDAIPIKVEGIDRVIAISSRWSNSVFLTDDGSVWVCGDNSNGQKGDGTVDKSVQMLKPVKVLGPESVATPIVLPSTSNTSVPTTNNTSAMNSALAPTASQNNGVLSIMVIGLAFGFFILCCVAYVFIPRKM